MTRPHVALVCYASEGFYAQQQVLARSAREIGIEHVELWTRERLRKTEFYERHKHILDARRGSGYWLWKPYIVLTELERAMPGSFVVYSDCGYPWRPQCLRRPLDSILKWCEEHSGGMLPGIYIPEHGPNRRWTKRECFVAMGCDSAYFWDHPQIQATFSFWQKREPVLQFVAEWLRWCLIPQALTDERVCPDILDFPDFRDHRHDQSILTNLALMRGVRCFGDPQATHRGTKLIDSLTDRIEGKWLSLVCRDYYRRALGKFDYWNCKSSRSSAGARRHGPAER